MSDQTALPNQQQPMESNAANEQPVIQTRYIVLGIVGLLVLLAILVVLVIVAIRNPSHTQTFRDLAIIALAAESGLIGLALIVLIVQVARLINMLDYEIKPILLSTSKTVNTVRGTADFMSEYMVSPMIRASGTASGLARLASAVRGLFKLGKSQTYSEETKNDSLK